MLLLASTFVNWVVIGHEAMENRSFSSATYLPRQGFIRDCGVPGTRSLGTSTLYVLSTLEVHYVDSFILVLSIPVVARAQRRIVRRSMI
jgi:hypothetical protein